MAWPLGYRYTFKILTKLEGFMHIKRFKPLTGLMLFILTTFYSFQTYAVPMFISDYAHVVSHETKKQIDQSLLKIQNDHKLHMNIVIFANFEGKNPEGLMDYYYQQLLSQNPGIPGKAVLLISLDDLYVNLRISENVAPVITDEIKDSIILQASKDMRAENYSKMATEPVKTIYMLFNPDAQPVTPTTTKQSSSNGMLLLLLLLAAAGGGAAFWFMRKKK